MNKKLSEKWIKASITGTIWAASEIVLGSFLHNLNIPFSGNILTAIGLIILISISYIWNDRGLFWRAGVICAVMKTMSPSAVIFGPMIAIFSESVLLEASTRMLGKNIAGFALGSMLAMSWNLFQKIFSYIIYYGSNIIDLYTNLLRMAQKQLNIKTDIVWLPIIILLVVYALFGLVAAVIGIRVGRRMLQQPAVTTILKSNEPVQNFFRKSGKDFNYSVTWLLYDILALIASFIILSKTSWPVWVPATILFSVIWVLRYRRAMRQLSKPKFWIFFVAITLLTAFVFTAGGTGNFWQEGLLTGIQMNFRAIAIIFGFSAIGTELYNPVVRNFFSRTRYRNLPLAVELSVESLPDFIAAIPDFKSFVRNPVSIFYQVLSHAGNRFSEIRGRNRRIFILAGARQEGKTSFAIKLADYLRSNEIQLNGFLALRNMDGSETTGYDLENIKTGERHNFLVSKDQPGAGRIGKFSIVDEGLLFGKAIIQEALPGKNQLIIIDEVGALELRGEGWADSLGSLVTESTDHLLLIVRDENVKEVIRKWDLAGAELINIREVTVEQAGKDIVNKLTV
jgi:nucleoside-triphosphatase THEP1